MFNEKKNQMNGHMFVNKLFNISFRHLLNPLNINLKLHFHKFTRKVFIKCIIESKNNKFVNMKL